MGVASCLFVVHWAGARPSWLDERLNKLVRFYEPLGARGAMTTEVGDDAIAGEIEFDSVDGGRGRERSAAQPANPWVAEWGGPLPLELRSPRGLLDATDDELRRIRGIGTALALDGGELRLVTSPVGPTPLYACASGELTVWSTHATAGAWLARGDVALRSDALPEFLACEFVGGDKTHLEGVRAIPPCARIDLRADGHSESVYWPLAERWAAVPGEEAADLAERALLASLDARLRDRGEPLCGLTAGADSRVVALALREVLEGRFRAFTWGEQGSPDVTAPRRSPENWTSLMCGAASPGTPTTRSARQPRPPCDGRMDSSRCVPLGGPRSLGGKWASRLQTGFADGEALATQSAFLLAAPLALERAARRM